MSVVNLRFFFLCSLFKVFFFATCSAFCALSLLFRKIFLCRSSNLCGGLCFNEVIFFIPPASFFFSSFIHCCRLFWGGEVHLRGGGAGSIFFAKSPKNPSAPFWPPMHVVGHFQVKKCPFGGGFWGIWLNKCLQTFFWDTSYTAKPVFWGAGYEKEVFVVYLCSISSELGVTCGHFFFHFRKQNFDHFGCSNACFQGAGEATSLPTRARRVYFLALAWSWLFGLYFANLSHHQKINCFLVYGTNGYFGIIWTTTLDWTKRVLNPKCWMPSIVGSFVVWVALDGGYEGMMGRRDMGRHLHWVSFEIETVLFFEACRHSELIGRMLWGFYVYFSLSDFLGVSSTFGFETIQQQTALCKCRLKSSTSIGSSSRFHFLILKKRRSNF